MSSLQKPNGSGEPLKNQQQVLAPSLLLSAVALAHSINVRGLRRTCLFLLLGTALPAVSEYVVINKLRMLRHHTGPQFDGVPVGAILGWYNIGYASFALMESLLAPLKLTERARLGVLSSTTALFATNLDLLLDAASLDQGLWEWTDGGLYAREIAGPNGKQGIPVFNFVGWVGLTSVVVFLYLIISPRWTQDRRSPRATHRTSRIWAASVLLVYYLGSLVWAIRQRKIRFIIYSLFVPVILLLACRDT